MTRIRQINAETEHIPPAALKLWQDAGPGRVRRELAERLRRIADRGGLTIDDLVRAVGHLMLLISADNLTDRTPCRTRPNSKSWSPPECTPYVTCPGTRVPNG
ncbi:TetR/AcrR family transcriptional regulator C-terminal domain-containing protein [Streptosporangium sp. CA-135522]|uniref:TetR/AcrR family transcriptional regulator C-terminal domain-containing protein n=1 Tax=Streptosporangium sp. CA-135522 TaxID=3240072 RepID=UPI003D9027D3